MNWREKLQKAIYEQMEYNQLEDEEQGHPFIGSRRLLEVWRPFLHPSNTHYGVDPVVLGLRQHILESDVTRSLVKIASILVLINWSAWENFAAIFIHRDLKRRDDSLPFTLANLNKDDFLGPRYAHNFLHSQLAFLPITIEEDGDLKHTDQFRLPFNWEGKKSSRGSFGTVTKVRVARGYLKFREGEYNVDKERHLARKCLTDPEDWKKEVAILRVIRSNLRQHKNIMVHFGTVIVGSNFNIFFEWADEDLHNLLYNGNIAKKYRQPDRLFAEAGDLANAVNFLHEHIKIGPSQRKCYHMDLKPENIVVRGSRDQPDDPIGRWMIADFGISAIHEDVTGSKTTAQRYAGAFQPPEIDESWGKRAGGINEKGDIWSLGCILCMVLAFAVGGKDAVERLKVARAYNAVGRQAHDYFYVLIFEGKEKKMTLKRSVRRWLTDVQTEMRYEWVSECVKLILSVLTIEQENRPDALKIERELGSIIRTYLGLSRQGTEIPEHVTDSRNVLVRQTTQALQNVTQPTSPTTYELATGGRLSGPFSLFPRRRDPVRKSANESDIAMAQRNHSSTSTSPSEQRLIQPINGLSPSSGSSTGLRLRNGTTHTVDVVGTLRRKVLAGDVALCPMANHILVCLDDKTVMCKRKQNHYLSKELFGTCKHAYISGPYYALQGVEKENVSTAAPLLEAWTASVECSDLSVQLLQDPFLDVTNLGGKIILDSIGTDADPTFTQAVGPDSDSTLVLAIAVSCRGIAALLFQNSLRLQAVRGIIAEDRIPQRPFVHQLADHYRQEAFETLAFSSDGEKLFASGWKHWFMWDLRSVTDRSIHAPVVGKLSLERRFGATKPVIIPMTDRRAFLIYDANSGKICLYDVDQKTSFSDTCQMVCGIVTPRDDHLLYIQRVSSIKRHEYQLMCRSIKIEGDGPAQKLSLGQARKAYDLESLQYHSKAILRMAFWRSDLSCDLVIVSSTGQVVEVNISYGD